MTRVCPACGETLTGHGTDRSGVATANCPNGHHFRVMVAEALADGSHAYRLGPEITDGEPAT